MTFRRWWRSQRASQPPQAEVTTKTHWRVGGRRPPESTRCTGFRFAALAAPTVPAARAAPRVADSTELLPSRSLKICSLVHDSSEDEFN